MFYVGQKVVCIAGGWDSCHFDIIVPEKKCIYRVRTIDFPEGEEDGAYLRFFEIVNPVYLYSNGTQEAAFHHSGFRPVCSRPTSIEIFKRAPTPARETESV